MKKESPILKYTSVLLIVLGAVEAAVSIRGFFDIPALHEAAIELHLASPVPVLVTSGVFSLLIAAAEFTAGVLGYLCRARPKKAGVCIPCGIAVLSLTVLFNVYVLLFYPAGFSCTVAACRAYSSCRLSFWSIPPQKLRRSGKAKSGQADCFG